MCLSKVVVFVVGNGGGVGCNNGGVVECDSDGCCLMRYWWVLLNVTSDGCRQVGWLWWWLALGVMVMGVAGCDSGVCAWVAIGLGVVAVTAIRTSVG